MRHNALLKTPWSGLIQTISISMVLQVYFMLYCLLSILYFFSYCRYLCCHACAYPLSFWGIAYSGFRLNQPPTHKGQSGTSQLRNDSNSWVLVELVGRE